MGSSLIKSKFKEQVYWFTNSLSYSVIIDFRHRSVYIHIAYSYYWLAMGKNLWLMIDFCQNIRVWNSPLHFFQYSKLLYHESGHSYYFFCPLPFLFVALKSVGINLLYYSEHAINIQNARSYRGKNGMWR